MEEGVAARHEGPATVVMEAPARECRPALKTGDAES